MPTNEFLLQKIAGFPLIIKTERFHEKSQELRDLLSLLINNWIHVISMILSRKGKPKKFLLMNCDSCTASPPPINQLLCVEMISLVNFCEIMVSTKAVQSPSMIRELLDYQMQGKHYGLILLFREFYLYYVMSVDHVKNVIYLMDFETQCYKKCPQCDLHFMMDPSTCKFCKMEYCSDKCLEAAIRNHVKCYFEDKLKHQCGMCSQDDCHLKCSRCKSIRYCSKECQRKHWPVHKNKCLT